MSRLFLFLFLLSPLTASSYLYPWLGEMDLPSPARSRSLPRPPWLLPLHQNGPLHSLSPRQLLPLVLLTVSVMFFAGHQLAHRLLEPEVFALARQADLARPIHGRFPEWFGNPDVVGPSPWDFAPTVSAEGRRTRVLFLTNYQEYLTRSDTDIYELIDASIRHPSLHVDVWGPKWKDWDSTKSLSQNLKVKWGCGYWDVVWAFEKLLLKEDPLVDAPGCNTVFIHQLGDCHSGASEPHSCLQNWYPYQANVTLSRYAFELNEIFTYDRVIELFPGHLMHLYGHSPDAANEWEFYPLNSWLDKKQDAVLFGDDEGTLFPLRTNISRAIKAGGQTTIQRYSFTGRKTSKKQKSGAAKLDSPPTVYQIGSDVHLTHRAKRESLARSMREAKICVLDASLERKRVRLYSQALLSGCVIAGDVPTEMENALLKVMIPLQPFWSIEQINAALAKALADPADLQRRALAGFAFAREHLTNLRKADRAVLTTAEDYRRGVRGYEFPHGYSMRCRAYGGDAEGRRPPWCGGTWLGEEGPTEWGVPHDDL